MKFYYVSGASVRKEWRTVEPYILGVKQNGNAFLAALPLTEIAKRIEERKTGHYILSKIDISKLEVLEELYDLPKVARTRITTTPTIEVICGYMYDDE